MGKISKANIRSALTHRHTDRAILLDDEVIGRFVSYGKHTSAGSTKSVYGSRIYQGAVKIEVEGATVPALLNKVAAEISKAIGEGNWSVSR